MQPIIEAQGLRKRYGDVEAVAGIDFSVAEGEFFGLLGPNGAGKTSTIGMIACVLPVSGGRLTVAGLDVRRHDRAIKARLGVVPQANNLDPDLTVRGNLEAYARFFRMSPREARHHTDEVLALMGLDGRAQDPVGALSGGMARRLVLARAMINEPRILILDEPTTGLDPQARRLVWSKLRQMRDRRITVILSTHYMDEAEQLCDRLVIMDHGDILESGSPKDLIHRHIGASVLELRLVAGEAVSLRHSLDIELPAGAHLEEAGDLMYVYGLDPPMADRVTTLLGDPERVTLRSANLEDVFLRLTGHGLQE